MARFEGFRVTRSSQREARCEDLMEDWEAKAEEVARDTSGVGEAEAAGNGETVAARRAGGERAFRRRSMKRISPVTIDRAEWSVCRSTAVPRVSHGCEGTGASVWM
jgi:hypothetical protein